MTDELKAFTRKDRYRLTLPQGGTADEKFAAVEQWANNFSATINHDHFYWSIAFPNWTSLTATSFTGLTDATKTIYTEADDARVHVSYMLLVYMNATSTAPSLYVYPTIDDDEPPSLTTPNFNSPYGMVTYQTLVGVSVFDIPKAGAHTLKLGYKLSGAIDTSGYSATGWVMSVTTFA